MKQALVFCVALCVAAAMAETDTTCHNITGTCTARGFECVSGEVVSFKQRCDGVEDCSDGTDEMLCHHADGRPLAERTAEERAAMQQASCVNCNCAATAYVVDRNSAWWNYAIVSPTDIHLMTQGNGRNCGFQCTNTIMMGFYRKNRICRGWLCCARQRTCTCSNALSGCGSVTNGVEATHCNL